MTHIGGLDFLVNALTTGYQGHPVISSLSGGGFVVCWEDFSVAEPNGYSSSINAQIFDANGSEVGPELLASDTLGSKVTPSVTGLTNGGFVVFWRGDSFGDLSEGQIFDAGGNKVGDAFSLVAYPQGFSPPVVTALSGGGFVLAYDNISDNKPAFAQIYSATGSKVGGTIPLNDDYHDGYPIISSLTGGRFLAAWKSPGTSNSGNSGINARIFGANGNQIGAEISIALQPERWPDIAATAGLAGGGFVIAYWEIVGPQSRWPLYHLEAQIFAADGSKVGQPLLLAAETTAGGIPASLVGLSDGGFVASWTPNVIIHGGPTVAQAYDAFGAKVGAQFAIDARVANDGTHAVLAALADGAFVATWDDSSGALGDKDGGVAARIFTPSADPGPPAAASPILFTSPDGELSKWVLNSAGTVFTGGTLGNPYTHSNIRSVYGDTISYTTQIGQNLGYEFAGSAIFIGLSLPEPGPRWSLIASGDFNADTNVDALFLDGTTGSYAVWNTEAGTLSGGGAIGNPGASFVFKAVGDFNGDGRSDILFKNANGTFAIWEISGTAIIGGGTIADPGAGWFFKGVGDFNGDGRSDILFQNADGTYATWQLDGSAIIGGGLLGHPAAGWDFAQIGDYNGDGKSDILFRNQDGSLQTWQLDGATVIAERAAGNPGHGIDPVRTATSDFAALVFISTGQQSSIEQSYLVGADTVVQQGALGASHQNETALAVGDFSGNGEIDILHLDQGTGDLRILFTDGIRPIDSALIGNAGPGWSVKGVGDFNGDGHDDLVFEDAATGTFATWNMSGPNIIGGGTIGTAPGFALVGTGDLDGDHRADLIFKDTSTGEYAAWLLDNTAITGGGIIGNPGGTWELKGTGDFNGDGRADLVFQDASGSVATWTLDGTSIVGGGVLGNPGGTWQIAKVADLNQDGRSDLLFADASDNYASWLISGTAVIGGSELGNFGTAHLL